MKITGTQLFLRKTNTDKYLVCGLIKIDEDIPDGTIITATGSLNVVLKEDRKEDARGQNLDNIMMSPYWRLR